MLRYFYILCISLAIKYSLCYDYILDSQNSKYKYEHRPLHKKKIHKQNRFETKYSALKRHPDYEIINSKEPVAQIDVASFIHKPDEYAIEDARFQKDTQKSKKKLKSYQDYGSPLIENLADDSKIYLSSADAKRSKLNANQVLFEDSINSKYAKFKPINGHRWKEKKITRNFEAEPSINVLKHPYGLYNTDANFNHNPVKKSASKRMKFPFFFHSKNETQKLKNNKKRKLFCFNCDKKDKKVMKSSTPQQIQKDPGKKKFPEQEIIENILDKKISEHLRNSLKVNREKREDWTANRERQLKEIEELEKKINRVEIHTSGLQKR